MKIPLLNVGDVFSSKGLHFNKVNDTWYATSTRSKHTKTKIAEFVVVEAYTTPTVSESPEKAKLCVPAFKVVAKRLTSEGKWDSNGAEIHFFQTGTANCCCHVYTKIKVLRVMRRIVKFI